MDSPKHLKTEEVKSQLKKLIKHTLQEALEAELEEFLGYPRYKRTDSTNTNSKLNMVKLMNGKKSKCQTK
jgi:transposase-like protein